MTQRERILQMLKLAGSEGVRSDTFIANFMPRAAARIQELKNSGIDVTSEREGKYVRYRIVGMGTGAGQSAELVSPHSGEIAGDPRSGPLPGPTASAQVSGDSPTLFGESSLERMQDAA